MALGLVAKTRMARDDWFRRKSWTQQDQSEFFLRLSRARGHKKAQDLRIQALELFEVENAALTAAALELIRQHLAEFSDPYERTQAHLLAAKCYGQLGHVDAAIAAYRLSRDAKRRVPHLEPGTALAYPWYIVLAKRERFVWRSARSARAGRHTWHFRWSFFGLQPFEPLSLISKVIVLLRRVCFGGVGGSIND
jgi:hypothetical protein